MNAPTRFRPRVANIGFALFSLALVNALAGPDLWPRRGSSWSFLVGIGVPAAVLIAFLYPLPHQRLERRRDALGIAIGLALLALVCVRVWQAL